MNNIMVLTYLYDIMHDVVPLRPYDKGLTWYACSLTILFMLIDKLNDKARVLFVGLLNMYEVMGLHMCIALVGLDWGYE